ncbi:hypothetical protein F0562_025967 [Nyssa sinensis]|uniref:Uncharacterized protein n=1 Tax=Nyssa sinensis TaxID=561372 RepID=A0A5J5B7Q3_9ASTE|nr:hypothetical protein F0562_025967 [Nyssa sinensis]
MSLNTQVVSHLPTYVPDIEDTEASEQEPLENCYLFINDCWLKLNTRNLSWCIYLIVHNENHRGIRAAWLARKTGQMYWHPFNVGVYKNITLILGPNMLRLICPMAVSHIKDGISFPITHDRS